ncbi:hypothetical protein D3C85_1219370 [compost metagenome]
MPRQQEGDVLAAGQAQVAPQVVGPQAGVRQDAADPRRGVRLGRAVGVQQHAHQQREAGLGVAQPAIGIDRVLVAQRGQRAVVARQRAGKQMPDQLAQFGGGQAAARQGPMRKAGAYDRGKETRIGVSGGRMAQQGAGKPLGRNDGIGLGGQGEQHGVHDRIAAVAK